MSEERQTCHGCPNLKGTRIPMSGVCFFCEKTGAVIPHRWGDSKATFWRVPLNCPLPDAEVRKSEEKAPHQAWVTIDAKPEDYEMVKL